MSKILEALQKVNNDLGAIGKDQKGYGYNFRGIDDVLNTVGPLFKKHGVIVIRSEVNIQHFPDTKTSSGKDVNHFLLTCLYTFVSTEDGSELASYGFGEGQDSSDKAIGCATSNAYKYVIFEMFNIATADQMDSDQKTAKENKVDPPKKSPTESKDKPANKAASFRRKPAAKKEEKPAEKAKVTKGDI